MVSSRPVAMVPADEALDRFLRSTASVLALLDGVSDETWRRRPGSGAWSLAETVEHVMMTNRGTLALLRGAPTGSPLAPDAPRFPDDRITADMFRGVPPPPQGAA